jgi:hypothetical protein
MQLANVSVIVTRSVSAVMLISALFLTSCQSSVSTDSDGKWQVRAFNATELHALEINSVDQILVEQLIQDYKENPKDSDYTELTLSRVLEEEPGGKRHFVFDLQYADDVGIVYVVDSRNVILDKFLISPWIKSM